MGHLEPAANPLAHFPKLKAKPRSSHGTVGGGSSTPVGQPAEGYRLGFAGPCDPSLVVRHGHSRMDARHSGERRGPGGRHDSRDGQGRPPADPAAEPQGRRIVEGLSPGPRERPSARGVLRSRTGKAMSRWAIYERVRTHARVPTSPSGFHLTPFDTPSPHTWCARAWGW